MDKNKIIDKIKKLNIVYSKQIVEDYALYEGKFEEFLVSYDKIGRDYFKNYIIEYTTDIIDVEYYYNLINKKTDNELFNEHWVFLAKFKPILFIKLCEKNVSNLDNDHLRWIKRIDTNFFYEISHLYAKSIIISPVYFEWFNENYPKKLEQLCLLSPKFALIHRLEYIKKNVDLCKKIAYLAPNVFLEFTSKYYGIKLNLNENCEKLFFYDICLLAPKAAILFHRKWLKDNNTILYDKLLNMCPELVELINQQDKQKILFGYSNSPNINDDIVKIHYKNKSN